MLSETIIPELPILKVVKPLSDKLAFQKAIKTDLTMG